MLFLCQILDNLVRTRPNEIAYKYYSYKGLESYTYKELKERIINFASYLQSFNTYKQPVLVLLPPGLDYVVAIFACLYAGAISVPAYPPKRNHNNKRLSNIIESVNARFVLTNKIKGQFCPPVEHKLFIEDASCNKQAYQSITLDPTDVCFIQYTSGTTSLPKGVTINHKNLMNNLKIINDYLGYQDNHKVVGSWLPPYHDMGLVVGIFLPIYMHCPGILTSPSYFLQSPFKWLKIIEQEKITLTCSPNFAFDYCVEKINEEQVKSLDLKHWIHVFNGAEPIRYKTLKSFYDTFKSANLHSHSLLTGYGLAETTLMATGTKNGKWQEPLLVDHNKLQNNIVELTTAKENAVALVSSGASFEGHRIAIVNQTTGQEQKDLEIGEIWLAGSSVSTGYWNNPIKNKDIFNANLPNDSINYLRTGDLGFLYKNNLYVTGRTSDLIVLKGLNFYSHDIEYTVMNAHAAIKQYGTAVFTINKNEDEQLVILQEISREYLDKISVDEIILDIRSAVFNEYNLQIHAVVLLKPNKILKTSSGKVQRQACREAYLNDSLEIIHAWQSHATHNTKISSNINELMNDNIEWLSNWLVTHAGNQIGLIKPETSLVELGLDSIMAADLSIALAKEFNKILDVTDILECHLISDLLLIMSNDEIIKEKLPTKKELIPNSTHPFEVDMKSIYFKETVGIAGSTIKIENEEYINYASYNYLGMSGDPSVMDMAINAIKENGTSVSASRIVSGEKPLHKKLEYGISKLIGTEKCLVYSSGHATNVSVITTLFTKDDLIISDIFCHDSIAQGIKFSGARSISYPHNDYKALEKILMSQSINFNKVLIVTEGIFSMDGDIPDVRKLIELKNKYNCFLMIDEAHSIGTLGKTGAGIREYFDIKATDIDIWMGTLSKSFGSCGGYIAGSATLIDYLQYHAGSFIYSAGISPANTAAAYASLQLMLKEPDRVQGLQNNHKFFLRLLKENNIPTGLSHDSPILSIILGDELSAFEFTQYLKQKQIFALPIIYPAVPMNSARVRLFISYLHTLDQLAYTSEVIADYFNKKTCRNPNTYAI